MNVNDLIRTEIEQRLAPFAVRNQMHHYEVGNPAPNVVALEPWEQVLLGTHYGTAVLIYRIAATINSNILKNYTKTVSMHRSLSHPNIVRFQGAGWSTGDEPPELFIATENTNAGCLQSLLQGDPNSSPPQPPAPMPYERVVDILRDVASAMSYLHAQSPPVLHRNLRGSSIHLTHDQTRIGGYSAKVGGFECSRGLVNDCMTLMKIPAHFAPEIIQGGGDYTTAVDVYSFGILISEMLSKGVVYPRYTASNKASSLAMAVVRGHRPTIPSSCPAGLRNLIVRCWDAVPEYRPTFREILDLLMNNRDSLLV
ncbi:serine/threonineprotein kinase [Achlya hypogyna]|uniref:Serine/threonineprotein kinase n=1 Tax=Achlya hypogyna TaxID=1202772 RepID=A0A1V9Y4D4_ACHHY|nr:serine/threonineprotein kinase [Achlya hypogyna]